MPGVNSDKLMFFFQTLLQHYGPQHWWPGESPFEVMVGGVLTQNTNWYNVEKAISNLKAANLLSAAAIDELSHEQLAGHIRPAGYYNIKARRLKNLVGWFCSEYEGSVEALAALPTDRLCEELLAVNGIGRETADSIALYALGKLTFVVDTYTCRVLVRHGCLDPECQYEDVRAFCEAQLPPDLHIYNELHALIVQVGKNHCKPRPKCDGCPLARFEHSVEF